MKVLNSKMNLKSITYSAVFFFMLSGVVLMTYAESLKNDLAKAVQSETVQQQPIVKRSCNKAI